jgi:hypothetical protein
MLIMLASFRIMKFSLDPHPDCERLSNTELLEEIAEADERLKLVHDLGPEADPLLEPWLIQRRRLLLAELKRRHGQDLSSAYREEPSELRFGARREVNAGELQAVARQSDAPLLTFLPVLGIDNFIVRGWSHILAAYPKTGKTEFLTRLLPAWPDEKVLYLTEEPESVWAARLKEIPHPLPHVTLLFALALDPLAILERIRSGDETIIVLDTVRNLLGLRDETNNSEVARALSPYISATRDKKQTLIAVHHDRKGGGEHGEGIAGGHAFLGIFDVALELKRDGGERRRLLRGWGRVIEVPTLIYEKADNGEMVALGNPVEVALAEVKQRLMGVVTGDLSKTRELHEALGDPRPSLDQVAKGLHALAREGKVERDPPLSKGQIRGTSYRWRLAGNLSSDESSYRSEVKLDAEAKKEEGRWMSEL